MAIFQSKRKSIHKQGSVTVEAVLLFPLLITIFSFGISGISLCVTYYKVSQSFHRTAEALSDYAYLYYEVLISEYLIRDSEENKGAVMEELQALCKDIPDIFKNQFNIEEYAREYLSGFLDKAEDQIYLPLTYGFFLTNIGSYKTAIHSVDFSHSTFFRQGNEILLELRCTIPFPVLFFQNNGIQMTYKLRCNAWTGGIAEEVSEQDIWKLNNFERGKKIRAMFGGNLPEQFPVLSAYRSGRAVLIKSLDYRKPTYQAAGAVSSAVEGMLLKLYTYSGQDKPFGTEQIRIPLEEIRERELILVIPQSEGDTGIEQELERAAEQAARLGILFTIQKL